MSQETSEQVTKTVKQLTKPPDASAILDFVLDRLPVHISLRSWMRQSIVDQLQAELDDGDLDK